MATNFPTSLDVLTNPLATDPLNAPSHSGQHSNANDAVEAIEAKVGIDGSLVATSLDRQMEVHAHTGGADDGAQINHAGLANLTAGDPHTQYANLSQHEVFTANLTVVGNFEVNFGGLSTSPLIALDQVSDNARQRWYRWTGVSLDFYPLHIEWTPLTLRFKSGDSTTIGAETVADILTLERTGVGVAKLWVSGELEVDGSFNHDGTTVGFYGVAPVVRSAAYTPTNVISDRAYDANATTIDELSDVLGTLIADLRATGLIG